MDTEGGSEACSSEFQSRNMKGNMTNIYLIPVNILGFCKRLAKVKNDGYKSHL